MRSHARTLREPVDRVALDRSATKPLRKHGLGFDKPRVLQVFFIWRPGKSLRINTSHQLPVEDHVTPIRRLAP